MDAAHRQQQSPAHQYTTRIRHNITIKPPAYLRQCHHSPTKPNSKLLDDADDEPTPQPSTSRLVHSISPCPQHDIPDFPPPDVILHKDDAGSKVFLALARSLLSVDNRAITVKDLADLAVRNGLGCQSYSAATQAITTYLRMHNERCEVDRDQPLLLSHNMSGTDVDDDLIPGLYSLQGGNPHNVCPNRKTNFRKNTAVWYLSRATGAPCPFARAGIRLCDYAGLGDEEPEKEDKRRRSKLVHPQITGQKRKRPLRSCVAKGSSDSESEKDEDKRPLKKLTLRIRLNGFSSTPRPQPERSHVSSEDESSDDESMVVDPSDRELDSPTSNKEEEEEWRLPPYPRRSISIPCFTPSYEGSYPQFPLYSDYQDAFRRSPSLACSVGSPPPDSEDEADDFHITMTRTDVLPDDSSSDSESEGETQFESPGPRSPSAPLLPPSSTMIRVKEEPRDLQGMLDAWDDLDSGLAEPTVVRVEPHPERFKSEQYDIWDWDSEPTARVKQEDLSFDFLFPSDPSLSPSSIPSPASSSRLTPECSTLGSPQVNEDPSPSRSPGRLRSKTVPVFSSPSTATSIAPSSLSVPPPPSLATRNYSISGTNADSATLQPPFSPNDLAPSIASLIESMNSLYSSAVSPTSLALNPISTSSGAGAVVVHTCQPCTPPISATQIEDISVYQMALGSFHFLRRIDSDFVNLSPIVAYTQSPFPVITTIPNATIIAKGSPSVAGIWVPLSAAQAYLKDHPSKDGEFDVFLSDHLCERFPSALQDFVQSNVSTRSLNQFGRHFGSTLQATQTLSPQPAPLSPAEVLARQPPQLQLQQLQSLASLSSATSDAYSLSSALSISDRQHGSIVEPPLNATEQEIFELCVVPDWDGESDTDACSSVPGTATPAPNAEPRGSGGDVDMVGEQEDADAARSNFSDTSSLSSLESSPEVSGESRMRKEGEASTSSSVPSPPQDARCTSPLKSTVSSSLPGMESAPASAPCDPEMEAMTMEEDVSSATAPHSKRKAPPLRATRPLRRSKRVADLTSQPTATITTSPASPAAASVNTRSRRRGSRNSLS